MSGIHEAKLKAMAAISAKGIAKLKKNKDQGYNFRGIEDAMNEMSPILIGAGITITPAYSELVISAGESKSGTKLRFATVKGSFKFEAADGTFTMAECYGEGMDSSDKAVSKAQSVAYRTALFEEFVVPTMAMDPEDFSEGGGSDPDAEMLDGFRSAALDGTAALRKHYDSHTPTEAFWRRHSRELKQAAAEADKEGRKAA